MELLPTVNVVVLGIESKTIKKQNNIFECCPLKVRRFDHCGDCAEVKHRSVAMRNTSQLRFPALVCFVVIIRSSVCMFFLFFVSCFRFAVGRVEVQRWRLLVAARRREGAINAISD